MVNVLKQGGYVILIGLTVMMDLTKLSNFVVWKIQWVTTMKLTYVLKSLKNVLKMNGHVMMVNVFQQSIIVILIGLTVKMDLTKCLKFVVWMIHGVTTMKVTYVLKSRLKNVLKMNGHVMMVNVFQQSGIVMVLIGLTVMMDLTK